MAAPKLKYSIGNAASTTGSSTVTTGDTVFALTSSTNFQAKSGAGMVLLDEGNATEEIGYSTGLSGGALTIPLANRGLEGGAAAAHFSGYSMKGVLTAGMWNDLIDSALNILDQTTGAVKSFNMPSAGSLNDTNGNELIKFPSSVSSAVNEVTVSNAATGNSPTLSATGGDTNIDLTLAGKGTGVVKTTTPFIARITKRISTTASSATPTPNADTDDMYTVTALAAAAEFAAPTGTPTNGQTLVIRVLDNGTARALTFNAIYRFSTDLTAPTTTVLSKTLYMGFMYNSAATKWDCLAILNNF